MRVQRSRGNETGARKGQILVLFVLGLFAVIAMVALVIEGSNLFAQQRMAQNGADAAANAGTIVIAEKLAGKAWTDGDVYHAVVGAATSNRLTSHTAEYTDDYGNPIGVTVTESTQPIPADARGVHVGADRVVNTIFAGLLGINSMTASANATVVAGALSSTCLADEDGCTLLPVTFPVTVFKCDAHGVLDPDGGTWVGAPPPGADPTDPYWPIVDASHLPTADNPAGDEATEAILPLCKAAAGASGAFGWLDLDPSISNLAAEIEGPLNVSVDLPDWLRVQTGNANAVEDELLAYWHQPVLIPLYNGACREDPGDTSICPEGQRGVDLDPNGNNTWFYVHTMAVFYIDEVLVQGSNVSECSGPPGTPEVLPDVVHGTGFVGCLKGWFVNYVTAGPIDPGGEIVEGVTPIGIQLIR